MPRPRKSINQINVVPYIDVMLVLLIIFMVTAPLLNLGVDVELPQSQAKAIQEKKDPVIVTVDPDGNYFLTLDGATEALNQDQLASKVRAFAANNKDIQVYIAGDGASPYQNVMDAMAVVQNAGVERVGLMSQPGDAKR